MKTESVRQNLSPKLEAYKNVINDIEFMEKYLEDPDILSPNSPKFKSFLIQSFSYLHPDFHYLSFLNAEGLDTEIIKAARILQILPVNTDNRLADVFQTDVKKFWDKFFSLFKNKKEIDSKADSIFALSLVERVSFFKDIKSTLNYLNYELPVLSHKKLSNSDINNEINKWKELEFSVDASQDKSISLICDEEQMTNVNILKLNSDVKEIISMYLNVKLDKKHVEFEHSNFFKDFIFLTKNILEYKKNISIISSTRLDDLKDKLISDDVNYLENLFFIKKCLKMIKTLKSECS